ncbi:MAG TPA: hypothetical protein VNK04_07620 [Gemmataceae bacterium]|nr:hypothetical protein [Gemmataceae bacterium]
MCTFYVLPPRSFLGERLAGYLADWFPGLDWGGVSWRRLAEGVTGAAADRPGVYIIHREDLPDGEDTTRALIDGFGAEPGDEVVEVRAGGRAGGLTVRRWRLGEAG